MKKNNNPIEINSKSFKENIRRLEEITNMLEDENLELEDAIKLYEEGINLSKICLDTLKNAELKITELKSKINSSEISELNNFS